MPGGTARFGGGVRRRHGGHRDGEPGPVHRQRGAPVDRPRHSAARTSPSLSWVLNAYAIVFAALLVPAGRAADLIGRRAAFLAGMIVFGARLRRLRGRTGRLAARRRPDRPGGRRRAAHAGLPRPAAGGGAAGQAHRRDPRPGPRSGGAAAALGPVLGGALVAASWHWVFLVNVPIVGCRAARRRARAAARRMTASSRGRRRATLRPARTPLGAALFTDRDRRARPRPGQVRRLGLDVGPAYWARSRWPRSCSCCSSAGPPGTRHRSSSRTCCACPVFATATAANVVFGAAFGAMLLLVTLWCQDVWGWSALRTGLGVAPGPLLVPFFAIARGPARPPHRSRPGRRPRLRDLRGGLRVLAVQPVARPRLPRPHAARHAADRDRRRPHVAHPRQRRGLRGPAAPLRDRDPASSRWPVRSAS